MANGRKQTSPVLSRNGCSASCRRRALVTHFDNAIANHGSGNSAVRSHGVESAGAEGLFHLMARDAIARRFQHRRANLKLQTHQGFQIDPRHHDVSPQQARIDGPATKQGADHGQVLTLNQRHLPGRRGRPLKKIAVQSAGDRSLD